MSLDFCLKQLHVVHIKFFIVCSIYVCSCSTTSFSSPSFSVRHFPVRHFPVRHFPVLQITPLRLRPSFSSPANSTRATSSVIFQSCKFQSPDDTRTLKYNTLILHTAHIPQKSNTYTTYPRALMAARSLTEVRDAALFPNYFGQTCYSGTTISASIALLIPRLLIRLRRDTLYMCIIIWWFSDDSMAANDPCNIVITNKLVSYLLNSYDFIKLCMFYEISVTGMSFNMITCYL